MSEPGSLTLKERLDRIETTLEKLITRVNYIIYVLVAISAGTSGFVGLEAAARMIQP